MHRVQSSREIFILQFMLVMQVDICEVMELTKDFSGIGTMIRRVNGVSGIV